MNWKENDQNFYYDMEIDHVYIQLQFNKIKNNDYLYVVYFDNDNNEITDNTYQDIIDFIDINDAPVKFEKILFTSNDQKMIQAFYRYIDQNKNYTKKISYINGKPYPSLVNNEFNKILESIKRKISVIFEARKIKDNYVDILYSCKNGKIKFLNYTYDYAVQQYKVDFEGKLTENDIIDVLKNFIKEKEPDILYFSNKLDKKISSFLEENKFKRKEDTNVYKFQE